MPPVPSPMLATLGEPPRAGSQGWAVEFKWDGVRCIAENHSETTPLFSRNSNNFCAGYPELVATIPEILDGRSAVLDGEIVALDPKGRPSFSRLQRRMHIQKPTGQLVAATPTQFYVFDVLELDGQEEISAARGTLLVESLGPQVRLWKELAYEGMRPPKEECSCAVIASE